MFLRNLLNNPLILRSTFAFLFFLSATRNLFAIVIPAEGSSLNYRLIGFSCPEIQGAKKYKLEISSGNYYSDDSFKKNIVVAIESNSPDIIATVPVFGQNYTWHLVGILKSGKNKVTPLYHFSTGTAASTDSASIHLKILDRAKRNKDAFVFLDGNRALYDMNGNLVWYLPYTETSFNEGNVIRDIKLTSAGTITLLANNEAYEIDYTGKVLWKAPNDGTVSGNEKENYHHEFTRLENGHYMVLGYEFTGTYVVYDQAGDSSLLVAHTPPHGKNFRVVSSMAPYGTIIEYDGYGKVVWSFKASRYFTGSDLIYFKWPFTRLDTHDNAFCFDEKNNMIYLSFRDINRVIRIKYPQGTILDTYGEIYKPDRPPRNSGFFCRQHSCKVNSEGYLYLFNNNDCNPESPASIVVLQQPTTQNDTLRKIWEYPCPGKIVKNGGGGNVVELPDHSFFASSCNPNTVLFIVNRANEIQWSAIAEKWNPSEKSWNPIGQYRASIIVGKKEMEHLIWNAK